MVFQFMQWLTYNFLQSNINPAENIELEQRDHENNSNDNSVNPKEHDRCEFDEAVSDDNMEPFYSTLHAETFSPKEDSKLVYPKMNKEIKKAFEILKELLTSSITNTYLYIAVQFFPIQYILL